MADGKVKVTLPEDLINCSLCLDVFDQPKSLPCLHNFCLKCLQKYIEARELRDEFPCPLCSAVTQIPSNDLANFKDNFIIKSLIDEMLSEDKKNEEKEKKENEDFECQLCELNRQLSNLCIKCDKWLCLSCSAVHQKMSELSKHTLESAQEIEKKCADQIEETLVVLRDRKSKVKERINEVNNEHKRKKGLFDSIKKEIKDTAREWRKFITSQERSLLDEVNNYEESLNKDIKDFLEEFHELDRKIILTEQKIDLVKNSPNPIYCQRLIKMMNDFGKSEKFEDCNFEMHDWELTQYNFNDHTSKEILQYFRLGLIHKGKFISTEYKSIYEIYVWFYFTDIWYSFFFTMKIYKYLNIDRCIL